MTLEKALKLPGGRTVALDGDLNGLFGEPSKPGGGKSPGGGRNMVGEPGESGWLMGDEGGMIAVGLHALFGGELGED